MNINYIAVLVAAVAQFIFGAIWYMPLFGKTWGKIHGFDKVTPEEQKVMTKQMMPLLLVQFIGTLVTSGVFALLYNDMPSQWHAYGFAGFLWLGFILPTQVGAVIFGGTEGKWVVKKILIMAGAGLGCMQIAAFVFSYFG